MSELAPWRSLSAATQTRLLAYTERVPRLRVIDVDARTVSVVPTTLDRLDAGITRVFPRHGFFACTTGDMIAIVPDDLAGDPVVIHDAWWPAPALDPAQVWAARRADGAYVEYDAGGRVERVVVGCDGWALQGELDTTFVVTRNLGDPAWWQPGADPQRIEGASHVVGVLPPDRVVVGAEDGLRVVEVSGAVLSHVPLALPEVTFAHALSPDGRYAALDAAPMGGAFSGREESPRLWLCDLLDGTATPVAGGFDRAAYPPVFAPTGWVFVGVPSEDVVLAFHVDECELVEVPLGRDVPMPLIALGEGRVPSPR